MLYRANFFINDNCPWSVCLQNATTTTALPFPCHIVQALQRAKGWLPDASKIAPNYTAAKEKEPFSLSLTCFNSHFWTPITGRQLKSMMQSECFAQLLPGGRGLWTKSASTGTLVQCWPNLRYKRTGWRSVSPQVCNHFESRRFPSLLLWRFPVSKWAHNWININIKLSNLKKLSRKLQSSF